VKINRNYRKFNIFVGLISCKRNE